MRLLLLCSLVLLVKVSVGWSPNEKELEAALRKIVKTLDHPTPEKLLDRAVEDVKAEHEDNQRKRGLPVSSMTRRLNKFSATTPYMKEIGRAARVQIKALQQYKSEVWDKHNKKDVTMEEFLRDAKEYFNGNILKTRNIVPDIPLGENEYYTCPLDFTPDCSGDQSIRTFNGICNNLKDEVTWFWGGANRAQIRLLDPDYPTNPDGSLGTLPRTDSVVPGEKLPSARLVSKELLAPRNGEAPENPRTTYMSMTFGQFLDHDITQTPASDSLACTNCTDTDICFPINTTGIDTINNTDWRDCIELTRSEWALKDNCEPGERTVANSITAWIDASNVYSSSKTGAEALYDSTTGYMHTETHPSNAGGATNYRPLLPYDLNDTVCEANQTTMHCFKAGDVRQNENIGLTAMHTVWVRYHNHIIDQLIAEGSTLTGEPMFQAARRILSAIWQHLVYNEYLPTIMGREVLAQNFELETLRDGFFDGYDQEVNGDISVAFSTAAFRLGHSEIKGIMTFAASLQEEAVTSTTELHKVLFNPTLLYEPPISGHSGVDAVMLGLAKANIGQWDAEFSSEVREHLFQATGEAHGTDLPARNIQRGRDHGLKSYVYWREYCKIDDALIHTWEELETATRGTFRPGAIRRMKEVYGNSDKNVEDIDLYPAAMSEMHTPNAQVGPTFSCIVADQFRKLKLGDRFYYENTGIFSEGELREIRRASFARVLCDTLDSPGSIQPNVLMQPNGDRNTRVPCDEIRTINFGEFVSDQNVNNTPGQNNGGNPGVKGGQNKGANPGVKGGQNKGANPGVKGGQNKGANPGVKGRRPPQA